MKKSTIVLYIIAALCVLSSFTVITTDLETGLMTIAVGAVLGYIGFSQQKKYKKEMEEEAQRKAEEEEKQRIYWETHDVIELYVAGSTFKNKDGKSRQKILKEIYDEFPATPVADGSFEQYEYEGSPAVHVFAEDQCIGSVRKCDLEDILPFINNVENATVSVDKFEDDEGKTKYSAKIIAVYSI